MAILPAILPRFIQWSMITGPTNSLVPQKLLFDHAECAE